ncbi:MAG TPA: hypothetical protein VF169_24330 [Albitalea sp.]|uniref:hypothetical protein n=1 Tax=Piscinibacter sp. TaxID=1903157 RepID=UPI002ED2B54C
MSNEARGPGQPDARPQPGTIPAPVDTPTADVLQAMGYEAADPVLQAPLWTEAMGSGPTARNPR